MSPQSEQNPDNTPELEALLQLTTDSNETLNGIEATNEAAAIALEDIASNQETQLVQDEENTKKVVEPLERIAENTKNVGEVLEKNSEPISKLAAFLTDMKGDKGETGKKGDKGDKGETGDKGDAGTKGDTGERGEVGEKGDKGDSIKGDSGKDGINGKDGVDGRDGKDGLSPDVTGFTQEMEEKVMKIADTKYEEVASVLSKKIGSKTYSMAELSDTQTATVNQVMVKQSDGSWAPATQSGGGGASPLTTKGDLYTRSTVDARLPVGTNGQVLSADSAETTGLKWIALAGGGDMLLAASQTVSALKTFLAGTLGLRNVANTFTSFFTNANTAARTYTLKDANGTLAFTSDITGTNSGTNTGDQTSIVGITGTLAQFNTAITDADITPITRAINTTAPLAGGGDLSADRTLTTSMATNKLIGRGTAGTGVFEEITLGTNLSLTGTTLNATGGGGVAWGAITGTLSSQTDLQTALNAKTTKAFAIAMAVAL